MVVVFGQKIKVRFFEIELKSIRVFLTRGCHWVVARCFELKVVGWKFQKDLDDAEDWL
jgi:hypothetical protein